MKPKLYLKAIHHLPWLLLATACGTSQERSVTSYSETDVNLELINDDHAELNIADNDVFIKAIPGIFCLAINLSIFSNEQLTPSFNFAGFLPLANLRLDP